MVEDYSVPGLHLECPQCGSRKNWRDGWKHFADGRPSVQRHYCRQCGFRFTDRLQKNGRENGFNVVRNKLESLNNHVNKKVLGEFAVETPKNSSKAVALKQSETRTTSGPAGATQLTNTEANTKIFQHAWWMKKEGYSENTISRRMRLLSTIVKRGGNLLSPDSVKETIARQDKWSPKTKELAAEAYSCYLKMVGGAWKPPRFMAVEKLPFIPTGEEINQLIAGCNRKVAVFLQLLAETGMRSGEAWNLRWVDFDFERKQVRITPEKGSKPRALKVSDRLVAMLKSLKTFNTSQKPFVGSLRHFARTFRRCRTKTTYKLRNSRINQITFHTIRHWKATIEYHRTKDILHVKELLGHRSIQSTLIYTQLVNFEDDDFACCTAQSVKEAKELIEAGFEYVCEIDNAKLFRKRK